MPDTKVKFDGLDPLVIATDAEAKAGTVNNKLMTPLRTQALIDIDTLTDIQTSVALSYKTLAPFRLGTNPTTSITVAAIPFFFDGNTNAIVASEFRKRINAPFATGNDNGGLDTGSVANNTFYYVWIITNAANTSVEALFSLSASSPTMPSGFTKKVRVGSVRTDGSAAIASFVTVLNESVSNAANQVQIVLEGTSAGLTNFVIKHGTDWSTDTNRFLFSSTGNFTATGDVTAFSDERLKKDVAPIENALETVKALQGVSYKDINTSRDKIGVIAQAVEKILPQVVHTHDDGFKSVAYANIVALLIEAIKELDDKIESK